MSVNKVMLLGHLAQDPDLRYTPQGLAVADFSLTLTYTIRKEGQADRDKTQTIDLTTFGKNAELLAEHKKKGHEVFVEARLDMEEWTDKKTGDPRKKLKVIADRITFLGEHKQGAPAQKEEEVGW